MLMAREVILLPPRVGGTVMGVCGNIMQLRRPLVVSIVRGHNLKRPDLPGLRVGFFGKFIGAIRVLQRAFGMPVFRRVIALFIVLGSGSMGLRRPFVGFSGFSM
jgi:hypothetical protein